MTYGEFIKGQLKAFGVTDLDLYYCDIDVSQPFVSVAEAEKGMIPLIRKIALYPKLKNVSENGFSVSWDMDGLGRLYMSLCRRYGVTPDAEVQATLGLSLIRDLSNLW